MQAAENKAAPPADPPDFEGVRDLARNDMQAVDDLIRQSLQSDVLLVSQVALL